MATGVGLTIGASESVAAVVTTERESDPVFVLRDSILHMSADGAAVLGDVAPTGYAHSIVDFLTFVGSPAGIVVDDSEPYRAEDLVATALFCLLNLAAEHLVGPAEFYATHPPDWPAEHVALLREALDYLGLRSVMLTAAEADEPKEAALAAAQQAHAAVLATPAGTTPPDAAPAENAGVDTAVLPAIEQPVEAKAYSAAPETSVEPVLLSTMEAPLVAGPFPADPPPRNHTLALVGVAAVVLLALIGVSASIALHGKSTDNSNGSDATAPTSSVAHGIPAPIATARRPEPSFAPVPARPAPARKPAPAPPPPAAPQGPVAGPTQPPSTGSTTAGTEPYSPYYVPQIPGMTNSDVPSYPIPGNGQPYGGVQPFFHYTPPQ